MAESSLTVTFNTSDGSSFSASFGLDSDYNESYFGTDKSTFASTDIVYLKLLPGYNTKAYVLGSSFGDLTTITKDVSFPIEEIINFIDSNSSELSYLPSNAVSYSWVGDDIATPLFNGKTVTIPEDSIGCLKCTYDTLGDRLKLSNCNISGESEYDVLCVATFEAEQESTLGLIYQGEQTIESDYIVNTSVSFEGEESTYAHIRVVVKDICSEEVIEGASVSITGTDMSESGTTGSDGSFTTANEFTVGNTYNITISASGYQASGDDFLRNDTFVLADPNQEEGTTVTTTTTTTTTVAPSGFSGSF